MRATLLLLSLLAGEVAAQQPVVTLRATVTGNQEQPRVMYILPWQAPRAGDHDYVPAPALADELFRRLDRAEYQRELKYRDALQADASRDEQPSQ